MFQLFHCAITPKHCLLVLLGVVGIQLSSCSHHSGGTIEVYETAGFQPNYGPFDSNGNYVEKWADNPPRRKYISRDKKKQDKQPSQSFVNYVPPAPTTVKSRPVVTRPKATPTRPKPVAVKPKNVPPRVHTVKKGDTLYGLARKYGTSVKSIQTANRIKGSNIGIGQRLIIPR